MEFRESDVEKYLSDPLFNELMKSGEGDPRWEEYERIHSSDKEAMNKAKLIVLAANRFPREELKGAQKTAIWEKIAHRIDEGESSSDRRRVFVEFWRWSAAAALVLLSIGGGWWGYRVTKVENDAIAQTLPSDQTIVENRFDLVFPVDLPDGSTVLLTPGSKIIYREEPFENETERIVSLDGEAFFEVAANPQAPFYVYANGLVTKVVGTSFNVKAFSEDPVVEVVVKTGRVTVFPARSDEERKGEEALGGEVLNPDERVVLDVSSRLLSVDRLPTAILPKSSQFVFDDVPVTSVFDELQSAYNVRILFPREKLRDCKITAGLSDEPLYEKIRLICRGVGADYEVVNGTIVIQSEGCN